MIDLNFAKKIMSKEYYSEVIRLYNNIIVIGPDREITIESEQRFIKILDTRQKNHWSELQKQKK